MDFSKTLIRCSALGMIMTESRSKSESLSQTCKTYLRQLYREKKYGRKKDIISKYLEKGLNVEEDSITLYARYKQRMFKKNDLRIDNEWIIGEPDFYEGADIRNAQIIYDTKSAWDLFTLPFPDDKLDKNYEYQGTGYMDLTGAKKAFFPYCLVNAPPFLIQKEIDSIRWRTGIEATEEQRGKIIKNMTYDDIPINERIVEFSFDRNEETIKAIHNRVEECREYLSFLDTPKIISI